MPDASASAEAVRGPAFKKGTLRRALKKRTIRRKIQERHERMLRKFRDREK